MENATISAMLDYVRYELSESVLGEIMEYTLFAGVMFFSLKLLSTNLMKSRKIRKKSPRLRQIFGEFRASAFTIVIFSLLTLIDDWGWQYGIVIFYDGIAAYGWAYFVFITLFMIVAHDTYFYWTHRLMHSRALIKHIHWYHHKSHNPTPWAAYSFDVGEAIVQGLFTTIFVFIFPTNEITAAIFIFHMLIRNVMAHSGYELFPRSWVKHPILGLFSTVTHHDMHHANGQYNFGLYFSWWDRMMGTEHPDYVARVTKVPGDSRGSEPVAENMA